MPDSAQPCQFRLGLHAAHFSNLTLGQEVLCRGKVTHVLSGHTHQRYNGRLQRADGRAIKIQVVGRAEGKSGWVPLTIAPSSKPQAKRPAATRGGPASPFSFLPRHTAPSPLGKAGQVHGTSPHAGGSRRRNR